MTPQLQQSSLKRRFRHLGFKFGCNRHYWNSLIEIANTEHPDITNHQRVSCAAEFKEADPERAETLSLIRADLMRRSSLFEELKAEYTSITYSEDLMNKILAFELQLANRKDDKCYKVSDIPES